MNDAGAFTNWTADEPSNCGNDIEQFGQLLATLLGHCHGSSEYIKVSSVVCFIYGCILFCVQKKTLMLIPLYTATLLLSSDSVLFYFK